MLRKGKAKQRERLQQQKVKKYTAEEIRQQREGGAQCHQNLKKAKESIAKTQEAEECPQTHRSAKSTNTSI